MVEGPGCTLNGKKIRARVRLGQVVTAVRGSALRSLRGPGSPHAASVTAVPSQAATLNDSDPSRHSFRLFNGHIFSGVETLGKELFMYFGPKALRSLGQSWKFIYRIHRLPQKTQVPHCSKALVETHCEFVGKEGHAVYLLGRRNDNNVEMPVHFGMTGSVTINSLESKNKNGVSPVLEVQLTKDLICFFDSSVEVREVQKQPGRMLCDVIMDQRVLPGVGNIIKNEALFNSGLHPAVKVCQLTDGQTRHLVKMIRDFSLLFYRKLCIHVSRIKLAEDIDGFLKRTLYKGKMFLARTASDFLFSLSETCREAGAAVSRVCKVYRRPDCGQCGHRVTVCRLGENDRMTYFCPHCQKEDPRQADIRLPARNTALSWTPGRRGPPPDDVAGPQEELWSCGVCTLINKPASRVCDACLTARPVDSKVQSEGNASAFSHVVKYPWNSFGKSPAERKINRKTAFGMTTLVLTDFSNKASPLQRKNSQNHVLHGDFENHPPSGTPRLSEETTNTEPPRPDTGTVSPAICPQSGLFSPPGKKPKTARGSPPRPGRHSPGLPNRELPTNRPGGSGAPAARGPRCRKHSLPCVLRVVRKGGENQDRRFYACPLPREAQCGFFEWADLSFPFCNHGKRSIMRTVLKLGPNNGKNFFVCPHGKDKQCSFFQWAENGLG